jgi:hypothetical protein
VVSRDEPFHQEFIPNIGRREAEEIGFPDRSGLIDHTHSATDEFKGPIGQVWGDIICVCDRLRRAASQELLTRQSKAL